MSVGRLTSACKAASCGGSGFDRLDMTYDGEGHRTRITETPAAGSPVTTRDFRYQGDAVVEELVDGTSVRTVVVDEAGSPVKVTVTNSGSANGTYLPTFSGHGDLLALWRLEADGSLTLANTVTYTTWGRPTLTAQNGIADLGFRRLYVGRSDVWWDDAYGAGLLYMHARSYVPALGRFLQPDPVAAEGNLYAYAENSPVTKADADGTFWYRVQRGDSLRSLARRYLGNEQKFRLIVDTNRGRIPRTRATIRAGQCIWIPAVVRNPKVYGYTIAHSCRRETADDLRSTLPPEMRGRAQDTFGRFLVSAAKCSYAVFVVAEQFGGAFAAGASFGAFLFGGELVPGGGEALLAFSAGSAYVVSYNVPYMQETVGYCLGGPVPTAGSVFLPELP